MKNKLYTCMKRLELGSVFTDDLHSVTGNRMNREICSSLVRDTKAIETHMHVRIFMLHVCVETQVLL